MELTNNPVFTVFAVCAAVLCLKMIAVGHFTGITRIRRRVYLNPEDAQAFSKIEEFASVEHPDVERGLRAHRNDLESTLPFLAIGLVYVLVGPPGAAGTAAPDRLYRAPLRVLVLLSPGAAALALGELHCWRSCVW